MREARMKVYIIYATTEGHTRKVVKTLGDALSKLNHEVAFYDVGSEQERLAIAKFDKVMVAGSVHNGKHQEALNLFVFANKDELKKRKTLFLSVSMAAAFDDSRSDAERYVREFEESTNWKPSSHLLVAGAIKHSNYGYYEEASLQYGDLTGHAFSELKEDRIFTDWPAVIANVSQFICE